MEGINILDALAVVLCACVSAMGLGGGGVLILYLTLVRDTPQMVAQGVNLLFFLPCAIVAIVLYLKKKFVLYLASIRKNVKKMRDTRKITNFKMLMRVFVIVPR